MVQTNKKYSGKRPCTRKTYSEETAGMIDEEMKKIIDACYVKAKEILKANEDKLNAVAKSSIRERKKLQEKNLRQYSTTNKNIP